MCGRSLLFSSQMLSIKSVSGRSRHASWTSHGLVYALGSSIVTLILMRPMLGLVKRISVGGTFFYVGIGAVAEAARELLEQGTYGSWSTAGPGRDIARATFKS